MQSHFDVLQGALGPTVARDVLSDLKAAGFIIVRRDAIAQAQREAVVQVLEDALPRRTGGQYPGTIF